MALYSDATTGISFSLAQSVAAVSPGTAYSQWALELGVSGTVSLQALDADDTAWTFGLSNPVIGYGRTAVFSSEGAIGLYSDTAVFQEPKPVTLAGVSRMYAYAPIGPLFFTFHPQADCRSEAVKLQKSAGTTILSGVIRQYASQTFVLNFAIKLGEGGALRFVLQAVDQPVDFKFFWDTARDSGAAYTIPAGATWQFDATDITPAPPPVYALTALLSQIFTFGIGPAIIYGIPQRNAPVNLTIQSGAVKDYASGVLGTGMGRVAGTIKEKGMPDAPVYRKVRLIREADGLQMRELWSHPITGAYSFDYVDELQTFTVLSYDHTGAFRAVVADGQIPELIA